MRPLDHAVRVARRLAEGDYAQRVRVSTSDEVGRLSTGLNALAEAVGERESRIRRLANTDAMTSLAQRGRFNDLQRRLAAATRAAAARVGRRAADRLQLELTESGLMDSGEAPIAQLRALRSVGVRLSIDDFGTGHSSLAYLQRLPVHELKIDRSFVSEVDLDARRRALVVAIVALGHSLGLEVTAEGVEREHFEAWRDRQSADMFECAATTSA